METPAEMGPDEPARARAPGAEVRLVRLGIVAVFAAAIARTSTDTDLWGRLRFGADILAAGHVPARDPYAFTSAPVWVNQSWLGDVAIHLAFALGGTAGLVGLKLALAAATLALVAWTMGRAGVQGPTRALLLLLCLAGLYPAIPTVRPQLFSFLLFAMLLHSQARATERPAWLLAAPPIMLAWANLHGAWLIGLVELGIWCAGELVVRNRPASRHAATIGIAATAALATLATPYGTGLWTFLWSTLGASLRDVTEWRSLVETRSPALVVWLALAALGVYAVAAERGRASTVVIFVWLAVASWRARRLLPFFSLATVCLLAPRLAALGRPRAPAARAPAGPVLRLTIATASLAVVLVCARDVARAFGCIRFDHAVEADVDAAAFIAANRLHGRMLTYSDWGLYTIWRFAPAIRVSMDGRRELAYPLAELTRHNAIYWNAPTALAHVDALAPDWIWLPANLPVVPTLRAHGWTAAFASDRSVVLTRARDGVRWIMPPPRPRPQCF